MAEAVREKGIKILNKEEIEGMRVVCRVSRRDLSVSHTLPRHIRPCGVVGFALLVDIIPTPC